MNRATVIARRELSSYFYSPIAYVVMTLFLAVCGFLFFRDFQPGQPAGMRNIFDNMVWLLVVAVPVLCMGLLAQEWASGTIETLMTAPLHETEVVVGKFLGALAFFVVLLAPTLFYVVVLKVYSSMDLGPIFSGYVGILLVGALFVSIGLFCSSLTRSQVVAAVAAVAILFVLTVAPYLLQLQLSSLSSFWRKATDQGVYTRYVDFSKGTIDSGHVVFFVAATGVFLFLTTKILESRRWK
ncbi:MAG: putative transporter permease protein [Phycisphaerales bacterium]|nr:putative transporter permease protein [Phycisphaerales bacterium]